MMKFGIWLSDELFSEKHSKAQIIVAFLVSHFLMGGQWVTAGLTMLLGLIVLFTVRIYRERDA